MSEPRVRFGRPSRTEVLTVDYTTVLHQAVENERLRLLREVRRAIGQVETTEIKSGSYSSTDRSAKVAVAEITAALDALESGDTR